MDLARYVLCVCVRENCRPLRVLCVARYAFFGCGRKLTSFEGLVTRPSVLYMARYAFFG